MHPFGSQHVRADFPARSPQPEEAAAVPLRRAGVAELVAGLRPSFSHAPGKAPTAGSQRGRGGRPSRCVMAVRWSGSGTVLPRRVSG